jgi:hypothetical protein
MASAEGLLQRPIPPLRRQSAFLRLWASVSVSVFGDQISALAIPLAAVLMLGFIVLFGYRLDDQRLQQIEEDLAARRAQRAATGS